MTRIREIKNFKTKKNVLHGALCLIPTHLYFCKHKCTEIHAQ